jgi:hypothetical protein
MAYNETPMKGTTMNLPDFNSPIYDEQYKLNHANTGVEQTLKESKGRVDMKDEDVKMAILFLKGALEAQFELNQKLNARIEELEKKSKFWRFGK